MSAAPRRGLPSPTAAALALVFAMAAVAALVEVSDTDVYWHLAGGRLITESGIPSVNTFSHTNPGHPWQYTQWLFGLLLYGLHRLGGMAAVEILQVLLVAASFTIATAAAFRRAGGPIPLPVLLPLTAAALSASRVRFVPRPHLVTYLGLAILLYLWERRPRRLPLWCGLAAVVWGNCHAGVAFGALLLVALTAAAVPARRWDDLRTGLWSLGAFALGSLANPNGLYPYVYSFAHLDVERIIPLAEFRNAVLVADTTFFGLALLALLAAWPRIRTGDWRHLLAGAAFLPLALTSVRIIPKFLLVVLPGLLAASADAWRWLRGRRAGRVLAPAAALALAALVATTAARDCRRLLPAGTFGLGEATLLTPEGAVRVIEGAGLTGLIYNEFDQGGYLAWRLFPGRRIFLDGRVQAYPVEFLREVVGSMSAEPMGRLLDKYRTDIAVIQRRPYGSQIDLGVLFERLGWPMIHLDGVSYVFVRPGSPDAARTADRAFAAIRSQDEAETLFDRARQMPGPMRGDLGRIDPGRLILANDFYRFGAAAYAAGDGDTAERFFAAGIDRYPASTLLRMNLGFLYLQGGRREPARLQFTEVVRQGKETALGRKAAEELARMER